jgi:hypothetical protein
MDSQLRRGESSVISETLFVRATDQILLIGVTDITELSWTTPPAPR